MKTLLTMGPGECRYPSEKRIRGHRLFCAAPTALGSAFCPTHHTLCYYIPAAPISDPAFDRRRARNAPKPEQPDEDMPVDAVIAASGVK